CFLQEYAAGCSSPARVGIGEKMADIGLADGAQDSVANGVHQGVCVGMALEPFGVRNFHATQNEFASFDQGMNIITDSDVYHRRTIGSGEALTKKFVSVRALKFFVAQVSQPALSRASQPAAYGPLARCKIRSASGLGNPRYSRLGNLRYEIGWTPGHNSS